ncbi:MAG: hypothetical protein ACJAT7_001456 [Psychromonas sp.]|jgi:hypothetical protein
MHAIKNGVQITFCQPFVDLTGPTLNILYLLNPLSALVNAASGKTT